MFQTQADLESSTMLSAFFSTQNPVSFSLASGNPFIIVRTNEKRKTPYFNDQPEILNPAKKLQTSPENYATIPQVTQETEEKRKRSVRSSIFDKTPKSDRVFHQQVKEKPEDTICDIYNFFFSQNTTSPNTQNHAKSLIGDQLSITDFNNQSETLSGFKSSHAFSTPIKESRTNQIYSDFAPTMAIQDTTAMTEQDSAPASPMIQHESSQTSTTSSDGEQKIVNISVGEKYQVPNDYLASLMNAPRKVKREISAKWIPDDEKTQMVQRFTQQACKSLRFESISEEKAIKVLDSFEWSFDDAMKTVKKQSGKYSGMLNPKFLAKYETRSNRG